MNVIVELNNNEREVYSFNLFELNIIFDSYEKQEKPAGKRKWITRSKWFRISGRDSNIEQPVVPDDVKILILAQVTSCLKVMTWQEYKNRP